MSGSVTVKGQSSIVGIGAEYRACWLASRTWGAKMELEAIGVTQAAGRGRFRSGLKFGKQAYCVVEVRRGEPAADVAKKLRELADQVARLAAAGR